MKDFAWIFSLYFISFKTVKTNPFCTVLLPVCLPKAIINPIRSSSSNFILFYNNNFN